LNTYEWCPTTRAWYGCKNENIIAARLVPYNTGEFNCDHLFGPPDSGDNGHLFYLSNGLPMHGTFKRALDTGCIIILPALKGVRDPETGEEVDFENDKEPFKLLLLDKSWIEGPSTRIAGVLISKIHWRFLEFRTDLRPSKRYLWFVAITTIARRRRCKVPGWTKDLEALGNDL
jgi:hypothetical protein